jgi:hypothetical protein
VRLTAGVDVGVQAGLRSAAVPLDIGLLSIETRVDEALSELGFS